MWRRRRALGERAAAPLTRRTVSLGGGVAIGMSECDVVARLVSPTASTSAEIRTALRSVTLTYSAGPRPGVYRFDGRRLTEMDRVELPPAQAEQKAPKKKPASQKTRSAADNSKDW